MIGKGYKCQPEMQLPITKPPKRKSYTRVNAAVESLPVNGMY